MLSKVEYIYYEKCDLCGANDLIRNQQGFLICNICGGEQEMVNILNNIDFDEENNPKNYQIHSSMQYTSVGTKFERVTEKFKRLEYTQNYANRKYENSVFKSAYREILRICSRLELPNSFIKDAFGIFKKVWKKLKPGKLERSYINLVPVVVYRTAQIFEISIDLKLLLSSMKCSGKKFKTVLVTTYDKFPSTNKSRDIFNKIERLCTKMKMPAEIKIRAYDILNANSSVLMATTSSVAASAAVGLSVISLGLRKEYRLYKIGKNIGASAAAISSRIFKVLKSRGIDVNYKITEVQNVLLGSYERLIDVEA